MTQPLSAGHLDAAYFFRGIGQPGGFLAVRGWFCVLDQESLTLSAALWVEDTVVQIRCHEPRPDVAAANAAYSTNSGLNVIIPISLEAKPELELIINFSAGQQQCGSLAGRICHPDLEIEQHSGSLSELRLKKLRNLVARAPLPHRAHHVYAGHGPDRPSVPVQPGMPALPLGDVTPAGLYHADHEGG